MTHAQLSWPVLQSKRLELSPVSAADAADLTQLDADPEVMAFLTGGQIASEAERKSHIYNLISLAHNDFTENCGAGLWVARIKKTSEFVGWFRLRKPQHSTENERELSYRLRKSLWCNGFGTEGAKTIITYGFSYPETKRIFASTPVTHIASRKVIEKSGLTPISPSDAHQDIHDSSLSFMEFELRK